VHRFRCYDNISRNAKCQRGFVLALCLVHIVDMVMWRLVIFCCGRMVFYFYYCRFYWLRFRAFVCTRITGDPYAVNLHTLIDPCCDALGHMLTPVCPQLLLTCLPDRVPTNTTIPVLSTFAAFVILLYYPVFAHGPTN